MTRRLISNGRTHRVSSSGRHASSGGGAVPSLALHSPSPTCNLHEEIDETLARWWRATRMGRRLTPVAK